MSVLVITKFTGDSAKLRQSLAERTAEFQKVVDAARAQGCIHHQSGIGEDWNRSNSSSSSSPTPNSRRSSPRRAPARNRYRSSWPKPLP
jgi:hypothetical protein